ncbi:MAG: hypothetical protein LC721_08760 [Actinobacteria bacterium]|nr:hypothetical protein [Actinomycetota bacterium]
MSSTSAASLTERLLRFRALAMDAGMTAALAARKAGVRLEVVQGALDSLARDGKVERVNPNTWRLAPRLRATRELYMRAAAFVREGEWTTYGDISRVVRGDEEGSQAVSLAAASVVAFPNPHRVLQKNGIIAPGWKDSEGNGPDGCRRRLEQGGLSFDEKGRADKALYVKATELIRRWEAEA